MTEKILSILDKKYYTLKMKIEALEILKNEAKQQENWINAYNFCMQIEGLILAQKHILEIKVSILKIIDKGE